MQYWMSVLALVGVVAVVWAAVAGIVRLYAWLRAVLSARKEREGDGLAKVAKAAKTAIQAATKAQQELDQQAQVIARFAEVAKVHRGDMDRLLVKLNTLTTRVQALEEATDPDFDTEDDTVG